MFNAETFCASAERLQDNSAFRVLLANGADVDIVNAGGRRPLQELEVLKEFRKSPMHDIQSSYRSKFGHERVCIVVDARYMLQNKRI